MLRRRGGGCAGLREGMGPGEWGIGCGLGWAFAAVHTSESDL